ncbi:hypothetical protein D3C78_976050 [compost metagenome]
MQAVVKLIAGGKHDYRCVTPGIFAQAFAQGIAIDTREHDVEHDQVIVLSGCQMQTRQAILGAIDRIAFKA